MVLLALATALAAAGWRARTPLLHVIAAGSLTGLGVVAATLAMSEGTGFDHRGSLVAGVALCGLLAVAGGGVLTSSVFSLIDGPDPGRDGSIRRAGDVLRGGAWIGALERAAVFVALVADWPEGIAITLALKGLGRYPELRTETPGAAERFIIGTFTSVLWAIGCAATAHLMW